MAPFVRVLLLLFYPIAYPISKVNCELCFLQVAGFICDLYVTEVSFGTRAPMGVVGKHMFLLVLV